MEVYVVERGEYSDREILGVFSTRENAVAFIEFDIKRKQYDDAYAICEITVDETKVTSQNDLFLVHLKNGIWSARQSNGMGWKMLGRMRRDFFSDANYTGMFFAKNKDHAIKMAQDAFAKQKAEEIGL